MSNRYQNKLKRDNKVIGTNQLNTNIFNVCSNCGAKAMKKTFNRLPTFEIEPTRFKGKCNICDQYGDIIPVAYFGNPKFNL